MQNIVDKAKSMITNTIKHGENVIKKGKQVATTASDNIKTTIDLLNKSYQLETVISNDNRFQDKCTMLLLMLQNDTTNATTIETVIINVYLIYALYYFQDCTFCLSTNLMQFMLRYPMKLNSDTDIRDYISMYEDYCTKR